MAINSGFTPICKQDEGTIIHASYPPEGSYTRLPDGSYKLFKNHPVCEGSPVDYCGAWGSSQRQREDCERQDICGCPAGRLHCEQGINPCEEERCHVYVRGNGDFLPDAFPLYIGCDEQDGIVHTRNIEQTSCCSPEGARLAEAGRAGGFDFNFDAEGGAAGGNSTQGRTACGLYAALASSMICSLDLAAHVQNDTLKVCLSSCEQLYEKCGPPGGDFPATSNYDDAVSLCQEAWGGFATEASCEARPDSFACHSGIRRIEVVDDWSGSCLGFDEPTQNDIERYLDPSVPREAEWGACDWCTHYECAGGDSPMTYIWFGIMGFLLLVFGV